MRLDQQLIEMWGPAKILFTIHPMATASSTQVISSMYSGSVWSKGSRVKRSSINSYPKRRKLGPHGGVWPKCRGQANSREALFGMATALGGWRPLSLLS